MFALFYFTVYYYPNALRTSILHTFGYHSQSFHDQNLKECSGVLYLLQYLIMIILSNYLFLSAGTNPGYVDETETAKSKREKAKLFVGDYDEFKNVDQITDNNCSLNIT